MQTQTWLVISFSILTISLTGLMPSNVPKLLLISLDGFRWDYLDIPKVKGRTPHLSSFIVEGVHARLGMKNCFPTVTTPNHFTLATGLHIESHGLVGNKMFDPIFNESYSLWNESQQYQSKWFDNGAEPIWVTNQLQMNNRRSGSVYWPASYAPIKGVVPYRKAPGYNFNEDETPMPNKTRIDTIIDWFSGDYPINLGLVYFEEPDEVGHQFGPDSQQMADMILALDEIIGYLLEKSKENGLHEELNIIVTSDHGMASTPLEKIIDLKQYVDPTSYEMLDWTLVPNEGKEGIIYEKLLKAAKEKGTFEVYRKNEVPLEYHYSKNRRIAPIVLDPKEHYTPNQEFSIERKHNNGTHGYNNRVQDMHPIFLAMGPAFKKGGVVETFHNIDVYPLMCHILGLKPAPNNGTLDIVKELLREEEYTVVTFGTFIAVTVFIALVAGIFTMAACREHRKMKRKQRLVVTSVPGGIKFSTLVQNESKLPLLSSSDDDSIP